MHTHHSHSGQFCQHAKNTLEEMVLRAIELKFDTMCLTEHMPRLENKHLYPEELASQTTIEDLHNTFEEYIATARQLQQKYADKIEILVGFETESINHEYMKAVEVISSRYDTDMFVGSLHHSDDIPIDFDEIEFEKAVKDAGSLDMLVFNYFIQLHGMVARLKPPVIGHFDLIRLFAPDYDIKKSRAWNHVVRTVDVAVRNDCLFEINSSAIRKGWKEAYPQHDILQEIISKGGKLCLSDDSHNVDQLGLNYHKVYEYLLAMGVREIWKLTKQGKQAVQLSDFKNWLDSFK